MRKMNRIRNCFLMYSLCALSVSLAWGIPECFAGPTFTTIDLSPSGSTSSGALGVAGGQQVGFGFGPATGDNDHALLWMGTAGSVVDLNAFLPADFSSSVALGIDASGDVVGYATDASGNQHAFLWEPMAAVPEPAVMLLLGFGVVGLAGARRFKK